MGDSVYWKGLVPEGQKDRRRGERVLGAQIAAGHEHSLQVHRDAVGVHYAVSSAGSVSMDQGATSATDVY